VSSRYCFSSPVGFLTVWLSTLPLVGRYLVLTAAAVPSTNQTQLLQFTYSIAAVTRRLRRQANFPFAIDPVTGAVTLTGAVDFETQPTFNLRITASAAGTVVTTVDVTIDITGVPCPTGSFSSTGTFPCNATSTCPAGFVVETAANATADTVCAAAPTLAAETTLDPGSSSGGDGDDSSGTTAGVVVGLLLLLLLLLLLVGAAFRRKRRRDTMDPDAERPIKGVMSPTGATHSMDANVEQGVDRPPAAGAVVAGRKAKKGPGYVDEYSPADGAPARALLKGGDDTVYDLAAKRTSVNPTYDTAANQGDPAGPEYSTAWDKTACLKPKRVGAAAMPVYDAAAPGQDEADVMYDTAAQNSPYRTKSYDTALNTAADEPDYDLAADAKAGQSIPAVHEKAGGSSSQVDYAVASNARTMKGASPQVDYAMASGGAAMGGTKAGAPVYDQSSSPGGATNGAATYDVAHGGEVAPGGSASGVQKSSGVDPQYDLGTGPAAPVGPADYSTAEAFEQNTQPRQTTVPTYDVGASGTMEADPQYDVGNASVGGTLRPDPAYDVGNIRPDLTYDNEYDGTLAAKRPEYDTAAQTAPLDSDNEFVIQDNSVRIASVRRANPMYRNSTAVTTGPATITEEGDA
jgi:hypothetical protein